VDVEAALGIARRRGGPDLFAAPDAEESPAAPLLRVTPATVLAGETEDEEHVGPTDERRPAAWSAAEFGTFLHRCLEIVDASADGARTVDTVIARGEWPTPGDDERDVLRSELTRILADPALAPFLAAVADGRIERELPFLLPHGSEWMSSSTSRAGDGRSARTGGPTPGTSTFASFRCTPARCRIWPGGPSAKPGSCTWAGGRSTP
jgi:hypothetical protein